MASERQIARDLERVADWRYERVCWNCKKPIGVSRYRGTKYCTRACGAAYKKYDYGYARTGRNCSVAGAVGELRVCADLLLRGYDVFRAVSPSSPYDLIAVNESQCLKVEVRTAAKNRVTGYVNWTKPDSSKGCDVAAVVLDEEILYFREDGGNGWVKRLFQ